MILMLVTCPWSVKLIAGKQAPCGRAAADSTNRPPPCVASHVRTIHRNLHLTVQAYDMRHERGEEAECTGASSIIDSTATACWS